MLCIQFSLKDDNFLIYFFLFLFIAFGYIIFQLLDFRYKKALEF